jgi:glycosyl transferase family 25
MERELRRCGVDAVFFPAFRFADAAPFHRVGSRGAYMSHLSILEASRPAQSVMILQDDLDFVSDVWKLSVVDQLPREWGIFYGSYNGAPRAGQAALRRVAPDEELVGLYFSAINGRYVDRIVDALRTFLQRERDHPLGGPMPIDGAFNVLRRQNPDIPVFAATPALGHQRSSRSDCADRKWFDRPTTEPIIDKVRAVKTKLLRRARP